MDEEGKKGGRGPDYVKERTGHTRRSLSHGMTLNSSHSMILDSNTPTQAKADRLPLPKCSEMLPQQQKLNKRCRCTDSRLASVKPLKPSGKNGERALSLMENINTKTRDFRAGYYVTPTY